MKRFAKLFETAGHQILAASSSMPCDCGGCSNRVPILHLSTMSDAQLLETQIVLSGPGTLIPLVVEAMQPPHFSLVLECLQRLHHGETSEKVHEELQLMFYEIGHTLV